MKCDVGRFDTPNSDHPVVDFIGHELPRFHASFFTVTSANRADPLAIDNVGTIRRWAQNPLSRLRYWMASAIWPV
jgi:hypothetical protein